MAFEFSPNAFTVGNIASSSGGQSSTAINAAYVHRTSGVAFAIRLYAIDLNSITDYYVFTSIFTGTKANITMRARVYNEDPADPNRPGSTLLATSTTTTIAAGTFGWTRFQFGTPYSPVNVGQILWIVVDNTAAAPATDFPSIRTTAAAVTHKTTEDVVHYTTTNGFSTAGTAQFRAAGFYVQGGKTRGMPFTGVATPVVTNTRARGMVFEPRADCVLAMLELQTAIGAHMNRIRIWESTQLPADTPVYEFTTGGTGRVSSELSGRVYFEPPFRARRGKTYYVCWDTTSNSPSPPCVIIDDYTTYQSAIGNRVDNFTLLPLVRDNGSNAWVVEMNNIPRAQILVQDFPPTIRTAAY